jgi:hypothetical protein
VETLTLGEIVPHAEPKLRLELARIGAEFRLDNVLPAPVALVLQCAE